jgi:hypothetical protein
MAVELVPYCVYSSAEQLRDSGLLLSALVFLPPSFSPLATSRPPSHDSGLTREEFRSGAVGGSTDGASAPGPAKSSEEPLKSPAIRAAAYNGP